MIVAEFMYRARQFWSALRAAPSAWGLQSARRWLSPAQMVLFEQMPPAEQAHSLTVMKQLESQLSDIPVSVHRDLMAAALLHDVGKTCMPLRLWERALIVLVKALSPAALRNWGYDEAHGARRAFVVAYKHPEWGAVMAAEAGASSLTVELIRRHQNFLGENPVDLTEILLQRLQTADESS